MLEIKFCKVVLLICFLLLIILIKIVVFFNLLDKFVNLCCIVLYGVFLGFSVFFKLIIWNMILRKRVIRSIIYEVGI